MEIKSYEKLCEIWRVNIKMIKYMKEKLTESAGTISGTASVLGSWQVCHSVCLGIIALLSIFGITVTGMPLLFLTKIARPVWIIAVLIFIAALLIYLRKKCISRNLIIINAGLIIAGTPFFRNKFEAVFLIVGGAIVVFGIVLVLYRLYVKKSIKSLTNKSINKNINKKQDRKTRRCH